MLALIQKDINEIMEQNMIDYNMSVIIGRAIPDVRDGLKPVHRRGLYAMYYKGWTHQKPHKKSAEVNGVISGIFHPHGESIHDSMAKMAQSFWWNIPLVDWHGNVGSITGKSQGADRYTEERLSKFAYENLMHTINKNAVDFVPNYSNSEEEPTILPSKLPLLLVNGSFGIAAGGQATFIPPHNLADVCNTAISIIDDESITVEEVAKKLVPDYPTGGILCSNEDIKKAYISGRGNVRQRAKIIHESKKGKDVLIIEEVPYGYTTTSIIENIVKYCKPSKDNNNNPAIKGISDIRDETAKGKVRIVIDVAKDFDSGVLENLLYKHTLCEVTQKIILTATNGMSYNTYNIKGIFTEWLNFRRETIYRVTSYDIRQAKHRIHILEGLLIALEHIDEIIKIIRTSEKDTDAKAKLMKKYRLSEIQTQAILDMKLSQLVKMGKDKLEIEKQMHEENVKGWLMILKDPKLIDGIIKSELSEIIEKNKVERKTEVNDIKTNIEVEDVIEDKQCLIVLTQKGYIKRCDHEFTAQKRGGKGVNSGKIKEDDCTEKMFNANTKDHLMIFTNTGRVFDCKVWQLAETKFSSMGRSISSYIKLQNGETVKAVVNISNEDFDNEKGYLIFATKKGLVKRTSMKEFKNIRENGIIAIALKDKDELLDVNYLNKPASVFIATKMGFGIRFDQEQIRETGRDTYGVNGIELKDKNDEVVSCNIIDVDQCYIVAINNKGQGKKMLLHNPKEVVKKLNEDGSKDKAVEDKGFPVQGRYGKGRIVIALKDGCYLVKTLTCFDDDYINVISKNKIVKVSLDEISLSLRPTNGSRIINLDEKDTIIDAFKSQEDSE
jgi:DNA gyrase subunit A